mmetsp:Transcript_16279/g.51958  ORF Transcript_16279/g.51958 Transcript_16279/m.51958 type:complete len:221 (+) Transcript_16279:177-839(+)
MGEPAAAQCSRTWCVLPCSGRARRRHSPPAAPAEPASPLAAESATTTSEVRAACPLSPGPHTRLSQCCTPSTRQTSPSTSDSPGGAVQSAAYALRTRRDSNCDMSALAASAVFAKTSAPDVLKSRRWHGRGSGAGAGVRLPPRPPLPRRRCPPPPPRPRPSCGGAALRERCHITQFSTEPPRHLCSGVTPTPAGLLTMSIEASSYRTCSRSLGSQTRGME